MEFMSSLRTSKYFCELKFGFVKIYLNWKVEQERQ